MDIVLYDEYFRLDGVRDCLEDTYFDEAFDSSTWMPSTRKP